MVRHIGATVGQFTPNLNLDFMKGVLPTGLNFTRATQGTYFDSTGILQIAPINTPRFDYDPATLQMLGLLIEEQRTNINLNNINGWTKGTNTVKSSTTTTAPDGSQVPLWTNAPNQNSTLGLTTSGAFLNSTTYTRSLYVKCISSNNSANKRWFFETTLGNVSTTYANVNFNLANLSAAPFGAPSTARIVDVGNGWYRLIQTFTTDASGTPGMTQNYIMGYGSSSDIGTFAVWGAQLEIGSFATSYIPTTTTAVTRATDTCSISLGSWYNQNEGTLVMNALKAIPQGVVSRYYNFLPASGNNPQWYLANDASLNRVTMTLADESGSTLFSGTSPNTLTTGSIIRTAAALRAGDCAFATNGAVVGSGTPATIPQFATLILGNNSLGGQRSLNGYLRKFAYYPRRLSNSYLQALTA